MRNILALHKLWLDTGGIDGLRADFGPRGGYEFWTRDNRVVFINQRPAVRLSDVIDLQDQDVLRGCDLRNARFDSADLSNIMFLDCSLEGASFVEANVTKTRFDRSNLSRCDLSKVSGDAASFKGVNLSYANLNSAHLLYVDFEDSVLEYSTLANSNLTESNLRNVKASHISLESAIMTKADLSGGDFNHAVMAGTRLNLAHVAGTIFDDAILLRANLSSITGDRMSAERAQLTCAKLSGIELVEAKFNDCILRGAIFDKACVVNSTFNRADIRMHMSEEPTQETSDQKRAGQPEYVIRNLYPSAKDAVFKNCSFDGAWIHTTILPWLSPSVRRSTINIEGGTMYDKGRIFIIHAKEDLELALQLYEKLISQGLMPWIDKRDLRAGEQWERVIPLMIKGSKAVIICLSQISVGKRGYVQNEFRLALDTLRNLPFGQVFILPVRLEDCEVPIEFRPFHWVDFWEPDSISRIVHSLKELPSNHV